MLILCGLFLSNKLVSPSLPNPMPKTWPPQIFFEKFFFAAAIIHFPVDSGRLRQAGLYCSIAGERANFSRKRSANDYNPTTLGSGGVRAESAKKSGERFWVERAHSAARRLFSFMSSCFDLKSVGNERTR